MVEYIVYYSDGSRYSSLEGGVPRARKVQAVITVKGRDSLLQCQHDFYVWRDGLSLWFGTDHFGLYDYLLDSLQRKKTMVLFGETISNTEWQVIFKKAKADWRAFRQVADRPSWEHSK